MRIKLVRFVPRNAMLGRVFDDVVLPFHYALQRLGHQAEIINNRVDPSALNVIFGVNLDPSLPWLREGRRQVIVNLEQFHLEGGRFAANEAYFELLSENEVWDYSESNVAFLKNRLGLEAAYFRFGYVPEMSRIRPNHSGPIDVLFYGALNERRVHILDELERAGAGVKWVNDTYGLERDRMLYESKVVINIHSGRAANLEIVRLSYLMANRKAVASEFNGDTERYSGLETACAFFPYENLVEGTLELLKSEERRQQQAEAGFAAFSAFSLTDSLRGLLGRSRFLAGEIEPEAGEGDAEPKAAEEAKARLDLDGPAGPDRSETLPWLTGPWVEWAAPEDDLPPDDSDSPGRDGFLQLYLSLWAKRIKACRYRLLLIRPKAFQKYWRLNKLEKLEREIADLKSRLSVNRP